MSKKTSITLTSILKEQPYTFEFHQAVKLVEALYEHEHPLGEGGSPEKEALILKSRIYLSSPPSDIYDIELAPTNDNRVKTTLHLNFYGIAGLQGPLPIPYTEKLLSRLKEKDTAFKDFLDLFNHRLLSVLHRIRKKYWVGLDNRRAHETPLGQALLSFDGMSSELLKSREVSPEDLIYYSGLYWQQPRSTAGLKQILSHYFGTDVAIHSHKGRWLNLTSDQWTRIGHPPEGQNNILGQNALMGTKVWNIEEGLQITLGPLRLKQFKAFLKNGSAYRKALEMIRFYLPEGSDVSIRLIIKGEDATPTKLDGQSYLGWTSWLLSKPKTQDDDQVILNP